MRRLKIIGRKRGMSKVKCGICSAVVDEGDCQLMTVIINEDGKKIKVCCTNKGMERK